ncbi:MAG TPA: nucleotidyltransferase family protein [Azospirillaceae bacterium]|nr:nucleotidyltransferase family protein [Azospirillaceae bacterium]
MSMPTHAMVLAAGLGLRMRPLTLTRPKPLIEVAGRTLLDHALDRLEAAGVGTAVVNSHYLGHMIGEHLAGRTGPRIELSPEETLLETAGGVRHAIDRLGDAPFFVVNADILWLDGPTPALKRMAACWDADAMDALLLLMPTVAAVGYEGNGDYHMDPDGRARFRQPDELAPFVYAGVQIIKPELYRALEPGRRSNTELWHRAEAEGRLYGMRHDGAWFHVGTPEAVDEVDALIRGRGIRVALSQPRTVVP